MHDAAGEGAVGAGPQHDLDVGLLHGVVVVDIDRRDLGAAFLAGAHRMRHHIDLGVHRIGAPDHDEVGDAHLARIDAGDLAGADGKSDARDIGADRLVEAGIFLHMGKAVDAVAHHQAHGAGVVIRPDRLGAEFALGRVEPRGDLVQRFVPRNPRELAGALRAGPAHRMQQPVGMMNALGVARDLGADDAGGIGLQLGAAHPADRGCRRSPRYRGRRPTGNRADRWNAGCRSWRAGSCPDRYHQKPAAAERHLSATHRRKTRARPCIMAPR